MKCICTITDKLLTCIHYLLPENAISKMYNSRYVPDCLILISLCNAFRFDFKPVFSDHLSYVIIFKCSCLEDRIRQVFVNT